MAQLEEALGEVIHVILDATKVGIEKIGDHQDRMLLGWRIIITHE